MPKKDILNFLISPSTELSPFLLADNQLCICNGVNPIYKFGLLIKDLGYGKVGSALQANKPIQSLFDFRQSSSVKKILATVDDATSDDTQLFYSTGGAWTELTDAETAWANKAGVDVEMEAFIGYCFFVGWGSIDGFLPPRTLTGTTFGTTNATSMPNAKYIKRYRDRLYIANCDISATAYPYRVYFSTVPVAGAITWTVATNFIDVDFSEVITGLGSNWDRLIVFTEFTAYLYDQNNMKQTWDIGCANNRTIKNAGEYMVWANKDNIWASNGGRPQPIGNNIMELIRKSTSSNWRAEVIDNEYHIYLGSTSANGISYSNCLAVFNVDTGIWRWRELYDTVISLARYTTGGDDFLLLGMSDGEVMKKSKYTDSTLVYADDGHPITSHFRTKAFDMGEPSVIKMIKSVIAYSEFAQNLKLRYRIFDKNQEVKMPFIDIGNLSSVINEFQVTGNNKLSSNKQPDKGYFIQFEGKEYSSNQAWKFYGLSIEYDLP